MEHVSENIKYYRKLLGMTRKNLAEGICDTSTLYRIEKGEQTPRIDILTSISHKLKVPFDFIVSSMKHFDLSEIEKYKRLCRDFTYHKDYQALLIILEEFRSIISNYPNKPEIDFIQRFIKWHEAIYMHEVNNNSQKALEILKTIYTGHVYTELDIGICNSIGYIQLKDKGCLHAVVYFELANKVVNKLPYIIDKNLTPLVGYNLAYCYYYQQKTEEAKSVAYNVLEYLEMNQSNYMLGQLKHMLAKIHQRQGEYKLATELLTQSKYLFYIDSNLEYYNRTKKDLQDIKKLINSSKFHSN